jgi:hypothetical protein
MTRCEPRALDTAYTQLDDVTACLLPATLDNDTDVFGLIRDNLSQSGYLIISHLGAQGPSQSAYESHSPKAAPSNDEPWC